MEGWGRESIEGRGFVSKIKETQDKRMKSFISFLLELSLLHQWEDCSENDISEAAIFLAAKVLKKRGEHRFVVTTRVMELAYRLIGVWKEN